MEKCPKCGSNNINMMPAQEGIRTDADMVVVYTCEDCRYVCRRK